MLDLIEYYIDERCDTDGNILFESNAAYINYLRDKFPHVQIIVTSDSEKLFIVKIKTLIPINYINMEQRHLDERTAVQYHTLVELESLIKSSHTVYLHRLLNRGYVMCPKTYKQYMAFIVRGKFIQSS